MMTLRHIRAALAVVVLVTACGQVDQSIETLPDAELVEVGAGLYAANCAQCHGEDLRGTDQGPSLLSEIYEPGHHADVAFLLAVQRGSPAHHWGFGDMLPVEGLSPEDVEAIVAYVREVQRVEGFEPYPP